VFKFQNNLSSSKFLCCKTNWWFAYTAVGKSWACYILECFFYTVSSLQVLELEKDRNISINCKWRRRNTITRV